MELRYWPSSVQVQESNVADWQKPDEASGLMVATTAYVLLTAVLKVQWTFMGPRLRSKTLTARCRLI